MKETTKIGLFVLAMLSFQTASAQCVISTNSGNTTVNCGDSVAIAVTGASVGPVLIEDFNSMSYSSNLTLSQPLMYTNPCGPSLDGTPSAWIGSAGVQPRSFTTVDFDLSCGASICFDLDYASDDPCGGCTNCEDPDLGNEGVRLQYSTDGGSNWVDINFFAPSSANLEPWYQWGNYCFDLPAGGWTASTRIRWVQELGSNQNYDHWGLDNLEILAFSCTGDPGYDYYWDGVLGDNDSTIWTNTTTTYNILYTNGIDDSCSTSAIVNVIPFDPSFIYSSQLCVSSTSAFPTITGTTGGVFSSSSGILVDVNTGEVNPSLVSPGIHTIMYSSSNGICDSASFDVDVVLPTVDAGPDLIIFIYDQITLTAFNPYSATLSWTGGVQDGVPFNPPAGVNTYVVSANLNGCINYDTTIVTVIDNSGINESSDPNFEVYPNPTKDILTVKYPSQFDINLIDVSGKTILKEQGQQEIELDLSKLPKGSYIVQLESDGVLLSKKIVLK